MGEYKPTPVWEDKLGEETFDDIVKLENVINYPTIFSPSMVGGTINGKAFRTIISDVDGNIADIIVNATNIATNVTDISGNSSSITQNATNINLRVEKDDVINQINISTEGILIDADNIQISGTTTFTAGYDPTTKVAGGGAAADVNAHSTTISGGKITTNSLTAAKISSLLFTGKTAEFDTGKVGGWNMTASKLYSDNVDMVKGTGAYIRFYKDSSNYVQITAAANEPRLDLYYAGKRRIKISGSSLHFWNTSGSSIGQIYGETDRLRATADKFHITKWLWMGSGAGGSALYVNPATNTLDLDGAKNFASVTVCAGEVEIDHNGCGHFKYLNPRSGDDTGSIGVAGTRWQHIYVHNTHIGDLSFEEIECAKCGKKFKKGEVLGLYVKKVGKETVCVPCHII